MQRPCTRTTSLWFPWPSALWTGDYCSSLGRETWDTSKVDRSPWIKVTCFKNQFFFHICKWLGLSVCISKQSGAGKHILQGLQSWKTVLVLPDVWQIIVPIYSIFHAFILVQLTGTRSPGLADDERFEIHLKQWELQREQEKETEKLHSCRGWCLGQASFSASKILQWVTAADSLPAHNLAALGLPQMIGCSQCSCWAWQKVSAQPSWKK